MRKSAIFFAALAIASTALVVYAPADLPYLWTIKTAAATFSGWALLLINPDAAIAALRRPNTEV
jgi:hypothetical protein